jgi:hypothetical protein
MPSIHAIAVLNIGDFFVGELLPLIDRQGFTCIVLSHQRGRAYVVRATLIADHVNQIGAAELQIVFLAEFVELLQVNTRHNSPLVAWVILVDLNSAWLMPPAKKPALAIVSIGAPEWPVLHRANRVPIAAPSAVRAVRRRIERVKLCLTRK